MNYFHIILGCLAIFTYTNDDYLTVSEESLYKAGTFLEIINKDETFYTNGEYGYADFLCELNYRAFEIMDAPHDKNKDRFVHWADKIKINDLIKNNEEFKQELIDRSELIGGYFKTRMQPLIKDAEEMDDMLKTVSIAVNDEGIYNRRIALKKIKDLYPEIYNLQVTPKLRKWEFR